MDAWDAGAAVALGLFFGGVAAVYWPAALMLGGGGFLTLYYFREKAHALKQRSRR